jgi:Pyruvate/2-oxoacid:ferredoxin oxidoreductase delta subunit
MTIPGSEFRIEATALVSAVSQRPELAGLEELESDQGWLISGQQGEIGGGLFSGGDSTGAGIAGSAIVQGRFAAERLHADLSGAPPETAGLKADNGSAANRILPGTKPLQNAVKPTRVSGDERLLDPVSEVNATITEAQFLQEVERCFSCGSCFGCERCSMYCTAGCFTRLEEIGPGQYFSLSLDNCQECGKCVEICPCGYLKTT